MGLIVSMLTIGLSRVVTLPSGQVAETAASSWTGAVNVVATLVFLGVGCLFLIFLIRWSSRRSVALSAELEGVERQIAEYRREIA
jgi:hypothetical protein